MVEELIDSGKHLRAAPQDAVQINDEGVHLGQRRHQRNLIAFSS